MEQTTVQDYGVDYQNHLRGMSSVMSMCQVLTVLVKHGNQISNGWTAIVRSRGNSKLAKAEEHS